MIVTKWDKSLAYFALFALVIAISASLGAMEVARYTERALELEQAKADVLELVETYVCLGKVYADVMTERDRADILLRGDELSDIVYHLWSVEWLTDDLAAIIDAAKANAQQLSERLVSNYTDTGTLARLNALTMTGQCQNLQPPMTARLPGELTALLA